MRQRTCPTLPVTPIRRALTVLLCMGILLGALSGCSVKMSDEEARSILPELVQQGLRPDVIVLDPPRKGADEAVLRAIAVAQPARVVYISCNPATQARDARILCAMGYAAQRCQPVDMFCQTAGVENVMLFERQQAAEQP